jgi:hypothetical protein
VVSTITDRVYGESSGVAVKAPCLAVALAPNLLNGLNAVGSYTPNPGDRILVTAQTDPTTNGIYNASTGAWARSGDFDGSYDCVQGTLVVVYYPNNGQTTLYQLTTPSPIIGSTPLYFTNFNNANTLVPQTAAEIAAGVIPVNLQYPEGVWDRYGYNALPGTTDMGPAMNASFQVALSASGSGLYGVRSVGLCAAYSVATPLAFGAIESTNMLPLIIEGQGWGTQVICNTVANSGALFDMGGRIGWMIRRLFMMGNDASKNDGIHAGAIGGTLQTNWTIEDVYAEMVGESFKIADTNGGKMSRCAAWVDQPPAKIVPQVYTAGNRSYRLHMTGNFVNNVSVRDFLGPPNKNDLVAVGIQIDPTSAFGVELDTIDVESGSGSQSLESGIVVNPGADAAGLTLRNIYCEGTIISLSSILESTIDTIVDGGPAGGQASLNLVTTCRNNTFSSITVGTITDESATNFGNTFTGSSARGINAATTGASGTGAVATVTFNNTAVLAVGSKVQITAMVPSGYNGIQTVTASSAGSVSFASTQTGAQTVAGTLQTGWLEVVPGNSKRNNCLAGGPLFVDWGGSANEVLTYSASMQPTCNATKCGVRAVVTDANAFAFLPALNPVDGAELTFSVINTTGGALNAADPFANSIYRHSAWTQPASGMSRSITFKFDTVNWIEISRTTVDIPN